MAKKKRQIWERQPWDTPASFAAFHDHYLPQMPPRSLVKAFRRSRREKGAKGVVKKLPGNWQRWSLGYNSKGKKIKGAIKWADRARAWEDHLANLDIDTWAARRKEIREEDWKAGEELRDLYHRIMDETPNFVIQKRKFVKGEGSAPDQIIITLALDGHLMIKTLEVSSKLQRLAAEMKTEDGRDKAVFPFLELIEAIDEADRRVKSKKSKNGHKARKKLVVGGKK